ncbi:hypothetical protein [Picosynechococcus sp. NKBG042902]|uniref:hypothetical protein n=1 Tax=Picosynechococcus sp. NKBG042902 TaxID=490193 RepID=UPI00126818E6|nr:hypothetical protein [Picosynechococcus sp. NKBG042902]
MKAITRTGWLFLVFTIGSLGFGLGTYNLTSGICNILTRSQAIDFFILMTVGLAMEIAVYKFAYRQWDHVFKNYAVSHFAAFFAFAVGAITLITGGSDEVVGTVTIVVWLPIAYAGQRFLIYVEGLETTVARQKKQIEGVTEHQEHIEKQLKALKIRMENEKRFGK